MCRGERERNRSEYTPRVNAFKDLFSSDYVLWAHADKNSKGVATVISVILQMPYCLPEVLRHGSGRHGTNAKFLMQIHKKLHEVVSGYWCGHFYFSDNKITGVKAHLPLSFKNLYLYFNKFRYY